MRILKKIRKWPSYRIQNLKHITKRIIIYGKDRYCQELKGLSKNKMLWKFIAGSWWDSELVHTPHSSKFTPGKQMEAQSHGTTRGDHSCTDWREGWGGSSHRWQTAWPRSRRMDGGGVRSFPLTQRNVVDGSGRTVRLLFPLPDIAREDHCLSCSADVCSTSPALFLSPDTVIAGQQKALLKARADEGSPGIRLSPFFPSPTSQCWSLDLRSPLPISALF